MSLLPQRKKSAEEIAKLRESLGIPGQAPAPAPVDIPEEVPVSYADPAVAAPKNVEVPEISLAEIIAEATASLNGPEAIVEPTPAELAPLPVPPAQPPKQVKSLKRSERIPEIPLDAQTPEALPAENRPAHLGKPVRSLRKSEQAPLTPLDNHTPPADSNLPVQRHSDREIEALRQKAAMAQQEAKPLFIDQVAHLALVIPGYLAAFAGAVASYCYDLPFGATVGCAIAALIVAGFIFLRKPLSRHHAAFISVIAMFVIVFGALYYFPQLRHGS